MKISFVELAGFRGFRDSTRIDFEPGFVVLTGRNGAGKSTVLDAIDFAITGTIEKFAGKHAKGGGLDKHIWWLGEAAPRDCYVTVGFRLPDGSEYKITRSRDRGLHSSINEIADLLCGRVPSADWAKTLIETTLIRDETLSSLSVDLPEQRRFEAVRAAIGGLTGPNHSTRTTELVKAALAIRDEQNATLARLQSEISRHLSSLTEARSAAEKQHDVSEAEALIRRLAPNLPTGSPDLAEKLRRQVAQRKQGAQFVSHHIERLEALEAETIYFASDEGKKALSDAVVKAKASEASVAAAGAVVSRASAAVEAEMVADKFASQMVALLSHGEAIGLIEGHCPLCNAVRSDSEFREAIKDATDRVRERGERAQTAQHDLRVAQAAFVRAKTELQEAQDRVLALEARAEKSSTDAANIVDELARFGIRADTPDPEQYRRRMYEYQEQTADLERALFILEASSAHDKVVALEARLQKLRAEFDMETLKGSAAERAVEAARQIDRAAISVSNQLLTEQFDTVMPLLKELYFRLRPHTEWRDIETDFGGEVKASLNFTVGDGKNPQFLFSSGQRRAFGLSFLLAIHLSRPWAKLHALLLDDPVQHIDDFRALNLVEVLSAIRQQNRQVVVAVEDPALADLLCRRLRSTASEKGRRYDLAMKPSGTAYVEKDEIVTPLPASVLDLAQVS